MSESGLYLSGKTTLQIHVFPLLSLPLALLLSFFSCGTYRGFRMSFFLFANSSNIVLGCFTDALTTGAVSTMIFFALLSFGLFEVLLVFAEGSMPFALSLCCLLFSANFTSNKSFCFCANIFTASFASIFFPPSPPPNSFSSSSLWCLSMCIFNRSRCLNGSRSQYGHCKSVPLFFFSSKKFASGLLLIPPVATMPFFFFMSSLRGPPMFFCNLYRFRNQEQYSEKRLYSSSVSFTSERFVVIVRSFVRRYRGLCFLV